MDSVGRKPQCEHCLLGFATPFLEKMRFIVLKERFVVADANDSLIRNCGDGLSRIIYMRSLTGHFAGTKIQTPLPSANPACPPSH